MRGRLAFPRNAVVGTRTNKIWTLVKEYIRKFRSKIEETSDIFVEGHK
jgi:hypothetical protein